MSFKFEFEHKIDGRTVSQEEWLKHLGKEALDKAKPEVVANIKADLSKLRCPEHGETPTIVKSEWRGDSLHTSISVCCDEMLKKAQKIAAGH